MRMIRYFHRLNPVYGGPVAAALALDHHLSPKHEVTYVSVSIEIDELEIEQSVEILRIRPNRSSLSGLWRIVSKTDCVVIHGPISPVGVLFGLGASWSGRPVVVYLHGMLDSYFFSRSRLDRLKYTAWWYLAARWLCRASAFVILTSELERTRLATPVQRLPNLVVLPYGSQKVKPSPKSTSSGSVLGLVSIGRIDPKKNLALLIRAIASMGPRSEQVRLEIHGERSEHCEVLTALTAELGITDRVLFPGAVYGEAKWSALDNADYFVLPSHQENYAVAVSEALARAVPVLISPDVGLADAVTIHGAGEVVPTTTPGWVSAIERALDRTAADYRELSTRAVDCALEFCSAPVTARAFEQLVARAEVPRR